MKPSSSSSSMNQDQDATDKSRVSFAQEVERDDDSSSTAGKRSQGSSTSTELELQRTDLFVRQHSNMILDLTRCNTDDEATDDDCEVDDDDDCYYSKESASIGNFPKADEEKQTIPKSCKKHEMDKESILATNDEERALQPKDYRKKSDCEYDEDSQKQGRPEQTRMKTEPDVSIGAISVPGPGLVECESSSPSALVGLDDSELGRTTTEGTEEATTIIGAISVSGPDLLESDSSCGSDDLTTTERTEEAMTIGDISGSRPGLLERDSSSCAPRLDETSRTTDSAVEAMAIDEQDLENQIRDRIFSQVAEAKVIQSKTNRQVLLFFLLAVLVVATTVGTVFGLRASDSNNNGGVENLPSTPAMASTPAPISSTPAPISSIPEELDELQHGTSDNQTSSMTIGPLWQVHGSIQGPFETAEAFGRVVSLAQEGTLLAVSSAPTPSHGDTAGQIRVYNISSPDAWEQVGQTISGSNEDAVWGKLSSDGRRLIVGYKYYSGEFRRRIGAVQVYEFREDRWTPLGESMYGDKWEFDICGGSLDIAHDGNIIVFACPRTDSHGYVRAYELVNEDWLQLGSDFLGHENEGEFGKDVALSQDGTVLAVGSPRGASRRGSVHVYDLLGKEWKERGEAIHGVAEGDGFGWTVSLSADGTIVAGGAMGNDDGAFNGGHARVFTFGKGERWDQLGDSIAGDNDNDKLGFTALAPGGTRIAVCGRGGFAKVFDLTQDEWKQIGETIRPTTDYPAAAYFWNAAISKDGSRLAIGAPNFDEGRGEATVYDLR